jgi:hypothetical protein
MVATNWRRQAPVSAYPRSEYLLICGAVPSFIGRRKARSTDPRIDQTGLAWTGAIEYTSDQSTHSRFGGSFDPGAFDPCHRKVLAILATAAAGPARMRE